MEKKTILFNDANEKYVIEVSNETFKLIKWLEEKDAFHPECSYEVLDDMPKVFLG